MFKQTVTLLFLSAGTVFADQAATPASTPARTPMQASMAASQVPDPRIRRYAYNENTVYRLDLYLKSVTACNFRPAKRSNLS